jgi:hypothetical protein
MSYDSGMTLVQLNAVTAERDALLAELADHKEVLQTMGVVVKRGASGTVWTEPAPTAQPVQPLEDSSGRVACAMCGQPVQAGNQDRAEYAKFAMQQLMQLVYRGGEVPSPEKKREIMVAVAVAERAIDAAAQLVTPVSAEDALVRAALNAALVLDAYPFDDSFWRLSVKPAAEQLRAALAAKGAQP